MRTSEIRKAPYLGNGSKGPDMCFVVDLYDNGVLIETRQLPNKSIHYAREVSDNWDRGLIKDDK